MVQDSSHCIFLQLQMRAAGGREKRGAGEYADAAHERGDEYCDLGPLAILITLARASAGTILTVSVMPMGICNKPQINKSARDIE